MKFLNIFNKTPQQDAAEPAEDSNVLSAITFSIDDNGEIFVDINISETDDITLKSLSSVLSAVASPEMPVMVLDMIKASLLKDDKTSEYLNFVTDYMLKTSNMLEEYGQDVKDEPFIKPSDMI